MARVYIPQPEKEKFNFALREHDYFCAHVFDIKSNFAFSGQHTGFAVSTSGSLSA